MLTGPKEIARPVRRGSRKGELLRLQKEEAKTFAASSKSTSTRHLSTKGLCKEEHGSLFDPSGGMCCGGGAVRRGESKGGAEGDARSETDWSAKEESPLVSEQPRRVSLSEPSVHSLLRRRDSSKGGVMELEHPMRRCSVDGGKEEICGLENRRRGSLSDPSVESLLRRRESSKGGVMELEHPMRRKTSVEKGLSMKAASPELDTRRWSGGGGDAMRRNSSKGGVMELEHPMRRKTSVEKNLAAKAAASMRSALEASGSGGDGGARRECDSPQGGDAELGQEPRSPRTRGSDPSESDEDEESILCIDIGTDSAGGDGSSETSQTSPLSDPSSNQGT